MEHFEDDELAAFRRAPDEWHRLKEEQQGQLMRDCNAAAGLKIDLAVFLMFGSAVVIVSDTLLSTTSIASFTSAFFSSALGGGAINSGLMTVSLLLSTSTASEIS